MRTLGATGVKVSRVALGTMSFGGDADENTAGQIWKHALDAGINLIDTADVYNDGRSEQIVGRLMKSERDRLVVATKAYFPMGRMGPNGPTAPGPNDRGTSRYHLVRAVEASLSRLDTDRIDLFYLHRFDDVTALDETLRGVEDLVRAGKIIYPAASNFAAWQVAHALGRQARNAWAPLVALQPMYNLAKRTAEIEILPMAHSLNVAVIPYSPTGGGLLTGKYGTGRVPEGSRLVANQMYATRYGDPALYALADRFTQLAAEVGQHPATLATAWVASHPAVTSVLVGGRSVEQLAPTIAANSYEMDAALRARISELSPTPPPATDRNEETSAHHYGAR